MRRGAAESATPTSSAIRWLQRGLLLLVAVMPFHAFLSVWAGHLFGHQAVWQGWKELLLLVLAALAVTLLVQEPTRRRRLQHPVLYAIVAFVIVALAVSLLAHVSLTALVFGLKIDTEFLLAFVLAWIVADRPLGERLARVIIVTSGVVIVFGLLQIFVLPADWLRHFGYGPRTIQPYLRLDPGVPAIRILSTLGGPNQLGSFLLLPLALIGWRLLRQPRPWQVLYLLAGGVVLWHTYARSAWLGIVIVALVLVLARLPRRARVPALLIATVALAAGLQAVVSLAHHDPKLQYYVFHETLQKTGIAASTDQHRSASKIGLRIAEDHLGGLGLGSAGPATFHTGQIVIPEDNYLQLAIETGVLGLALFMVVQIGVGWRLLRGPGPRELRVPLLAALLGVGAINFFLQGWSDSSTALIYWTAAGTAFGLSLLPAVSEPSGTPAK